MQNCEPEPGLSRAVPLPEERPMGNEFESELLKQNPRTLYTHLPLPMRERVTKGQFIELHKLVLDPCRSRDKDKMTLVHNAETYSMELQASNHSKECVNWGSGRLHSESLWWFM